MHEDPLAQAIARLVNAANDHRGLDMSEPLQKAWDHLTELDACASERRCAGVAAALADVNSASGAGWLANFLGALAERGLDPTPHTRHVLACMMRFIGSVDDDVDDDGQLEIGLQYLARGLIAHLMLDPHAMRDLQSNHEALAELERVDELAIGPLWVLQLVRRVSGTLVVPHGFRPVGVEVEYRNLSNSFHLFTLLQDALEGRMPGAREITGAAVSVARGPFLGVAAPEVNIIREMTRGEIDLWRKRIGLPAARRLRWWPPIGQIRPPR